MFIIILNLLTLIFTGEIILENHKTQKKLTRASLMVQWLRTHFARQGTWIRSLVGELRSHMPWGTTTKPTHTRVHAPQQEMPLQGEAHASN